MWAADALENVEVFERAATDFYQATTAAELLSCITMFERYATLVPADPLPAAYVARCRRRLHDDAPGWDGTELAMK